MGGALDPGDNPPRLIAAIADAVGAAYGAVASATGQYLLNGDVSAGGVGWGAAAGAVNASTGLVGKVSGWISGWF